MQLKDLEYSPRTQTTCVSATFCWREPHFRRPQGSTPSTSLPLPDDDPSTWDPEFPQPSHQSYPLFLSTVFPIDHTQNMYMCWEGHPGSLEACDRGGPAGGVYTSDRGGPAGGVCTSSPTGCGEQSGTTREEGLDSASLCLHKFCRYLLLSCLQHYHHVSTL